MSPLDQLPAFGGHADHVVSLDVAEAAPEVLPYASLQQARAAQPGPLRALLGVYEWQGEPLMYLADAAAVADHDVPALRRRLALRGEAAWLGLLEAGRLTVYDLRLEKASAPEKGTSFTASDASTTTLPRLALGFSEQPPVRPGEKVREALRTLLAAGVRTLREAGLGEGDAVSLVGRALFTRFLGDRHLLAAHCATRGLEAHALLDDAAIARDTCAWLDETFNGDLLPVSSAAFENDVPNLWSALANILHRAPDGQLPLGFEIAWDSLTSPMCRSACSARSSKTTWRTGIPGGARATASTSPPLRSPSEWWQVFGALGREGTAHRARVLDPAAGGGSSCWRCTDGSSPSGWRHDGRRPDTAVLRGSCTSSWRASTSTRPPSGTLPLASTCWPSS
ncbi:MAG: hypothetical protein R3F43_09800 [bacterium]